MSGDGTNLVRQTMRRRNDSDIVPLDHRTARWLARLERMTKTPATQIVASMLHHIMVDDEQLHRQPADETCH